MKDSSELVREIKIIFEEQIFHIIFTPAGNIFRCINEYVFGIDVNQELIIIADNIDNAQLIYELPMASLSILINALWENEEVSILF